MRAGGQVRGRGSSLPTSFAEQEAGSENPGDRKQNAAAQIEPVDRLRLIRQHGMEHLGGMILQRQIRDVLNVVLLANEQGQSHHKHIAERGQARRALRTRQRSNAHADAETAQRETDERQPEESPP